MKNIITAEQNQNKDGITTRLTSSQLQQLVSLQQCLQAMANAIPPNPYPEWLFPMTIEQYCEAIPDDKLRTAISGFAFRQGFEIASKTIRERLGEELEKLDQV